jgi:ribosomal protein S18 acetylase RimI-like enzyme
MSIESALEIYPKTVSLKSGVNLSLRPLVSTDDKALSAFLKALPGDDLLFLKERISDLKVIRRWCAAIDHGRTLHLLAFADKKLVGLARLNQDLGGWKRHIGRLNVHTLPEYRGKGIGRNLIHEMIGIARQSGLMWLEAEFFDKQEAAIKMFGLLGFSNMSRLPDYVKDTQSVTHDYILMGLKLITEEEYAGMG